MIWLDHGHNGMKFIRLPSVHCGTAFRCTRLNAWFVFCYVLCEAEICTGVTSIGAIPSNHTHKQKSSKTIGHRLKLITGQ